MDFNKIDLLGVGSVEKYNDFIERISYQQAELQLGDGFFTPDSRVYEKVNQDNSFKPFYGDTVVFDLDSRIKNKIAGIIDRLYKIAPECFCEHIKEDTIHMTLHDLSASENLESIASEVFGNEIELLRVLKENPQQLNSIKMKTNFIINMVSTSLVLTLIPADEAEWNKLQELYELINKVKVCQYPFLTPHITLAYFNYNGFDEKSADNLKTAVHELNKNHFDITLRTNRLYYQKFISMNDYIQVFNFA